MVKGLGFVYKAGFGGKTPASLQEILPFRVERGQTGAMQVLDARDVVIAECPAGLGFDESAIANMISFLVQKELLKAEATYHPTKLVSNGYSADYEVAAHFMLCIECGRPMVPEDFPFSQTPNFTGDVQRSNAGFATPSGLRASNSSSLTVCTDCAKKGYADFECYRCRKKYNDPEVIKEHFGDPADYLCYQCYMICPAKEWEELERELMEKHRWDYE